MQLFITILIIVTAVIAAIVMLIRGIKRRKKNSDPCSGCSSDCKACDFYRQMNQNKNN